ncbi:hypothetical protein [Streptomyces sp. NBC_01803]|uniref:hypothetical protein n=1 Tax=Streptomyces sp. NBC_01803 TaxID=2975946 RepID=UPI002DD87F62|nr:hypothetical protein [Streptomyces sp. NBC_01803]WSA42748.1 hypothetical protein OIE51_00100 [Streptomyces sp. NBC_01803]
MLEPGQGARSAGAARARAREQHDRLAQGLCPHHGTAPGQHGRGIDCVDCELEAACGAAQSEVLPAPPDKPVRPKRMAAPRWWECAVCRLPHRGEAPADGMCPRCPATAAAEEGAWRGAAVRAWDQHQALVDEAYAEHARREREKAERRERQEQAARRAHEQQAKERAETQALRARLAREFPELAAVSPSVAGPLVTVPGGEAQ